MYEVFTLLFYCNSIGCLLEKIHYLKKKKISNEDFWITNWYSKLLLSCQPKVTVTSCFVSKVIRDLKLIDHLWINPILRIGLIHE